MSESEKRFTCPVCSCPCLFEDPSNPRSYETCQSCGYEFGRRCIDQRVAQAAWRQQWIEHGMKWVGTRADPPPGWDPKVVHGGTQADPEG